MDAGYHGRRVNRHPHPDPPPEGEGEVMTQEYSFDVVSQYDRQELVNAVNQAQREVTTRYDFKDAGASIALGDSELVLDGPSEMKLKAMVDVLQIKLVSPKVQPRIQGDAIRVSSREKDLLQKVIQSLRETDAPVPLQFINYR